VKTGFAAIVFPVKAFMADWQ